MPIVGHKNPGLVAKNRDSVSTGFVMPMLHGSKTLQTTLNEWREQLEPAGFSIHEIIDVRIFARLLVVALNGPAPVKAGICKADPGGLTKG